MKLRTARIPRGIRLIALGMFLWGFGYGLHAYVLPVHLRSIGCSPAQVGFVFSVSMAAMAASCIPGGILADRCDRRKVIFLSWLAGAPSVILYYVAKDYRMAALGIAIYSGSMMGYPALNAYSQSCARDGESGMTFGVINAAFAAGMIASPAVGGYLSSVWGVRGVFLLSCAFFLIASGVVSLLPPEPERGALSKASGRGDFFGSLRNRRFVAFLVCYSVCAFAYYMVQPLVPQYLTDARRNSVGIVGALGSIMSLGQTLITVGVGRAADRRGALVAVGGNLLVFVVALLCFVAFSASAATVASLFLLGGFMAGQGVVLAGVGEVLGDRADGKAFALFNLAMSGVSVAGPYLGGLMYSVSQGGPFYAAAGITAVGGLLLLQQGLSARGARGGGCPREELGKNLESAKI
ncbi:MAG: MFS transporter [Clostridia bacterium]|nr:MFS transporter [Clostridia bacterium]